MKNSPVNRDARRGFSLFETLLACTLTCIIAAAVYQMQIAGCTGIEHGKIRADLQAQARNTLARIQAELSAATRAQANTPPNISIPSAPGNTTITFYLPTYTFSGNRITGVVMDTDGAIVWDVNNPVSFEYDQSNRQILRRQGASASVIATHVSGVTFTDSVIDPALALDEVRLEVQLEMQTTQGRTVQISLPCLIRLRN